MRRTLCAPSLLLLATTLAPGDEPPDNAAERLANANAAYERGAFEEAREAYAALATGGLAHETVYFNLGCSLARLGRYGEATLAFRRALRYDPGDRDARDNLAWVRARLPDLPEETSDWRDLLGRAAAFVPFALSLGLAVAAWWLGAGFFAASWSGLASRRASARLVRLGTLFLGIALVAGAAPGVRMWVAAAEDRAVVLAPRVDARSGPGSDHPVLFTAHEGFEVATREIRSGWVRVTATGGLAGWVPAASIGAIDPGGTGARWPAEAAPAALAQESERTAPTD